MLSPDIVKTCMIQTKYFVPEKQKQESSLCLVEFNIATGLGQNRTAVTSIKDEESACWVKCLYYYIKEESWDRFVFCSIYSNQNHGVLSISFPYNCRTELRSPCEKYF